MFEIIQIPALSDNYIYIIIDKKTNITACVDPAVSEAVLILLEKKKLKLNYIFNTHHHHDHVGGNLEIKKKTNCKILGPEKESERIPGIDIPLKNNDEFDLGDINFKIFEVPGHTSGHICFYSENAKLLFCGDVLFSLGCGRVFEGTNEQMWNSLLKIKSLPDRTNVYCGHEYTKSNILFALSLDPENKKLLSKKNEVENLLRNGKFTVPFNLGIEKKLNPFLNSDNRSFKKMLGVSDYSSQKTFNYIRKKKDIF